METLVQAPAWIKERRDAAARRISRSHSGPRSVNPDSQISSRS